MSGLLAFVWTNLLPSDRRITSRFRQENESDNVARRFSALFVGRVIGTYLLVPVQKGLTEFRFPISSKVPFLHRRALSLRIHDPAR